MIAKARISNYSCFVNVNIQSNNILPIITLREPEVCDRGLVSIYINNIYTTEKPFTGK